MEVKDLKEGMYYYCSTFGIIKYLGYKSYKKSSNKLRCWQWLNKRAKNTPSMFDDIPNTFPMNSTTGLTELGPTAELLYEN